MTLKTERLEKKAERNIISQNEIEIKKFLK